MQQERKRTLFAEERQAKIIKMLNTQGKLYVPDLCKIFNVSLATIRSDLRELDAQGKLKRTHGGAIACEKASFEQDTASKMVEANEEKKRIAQKAAEFVEDGDTIALDCGTSIYELAKCLKPKKNLTIVTNDVKIMLLLEAEIDCEIILIGGNVRKGQFCCVGPMAVSDMNRYHVDKAFIATNAFSLKEGFSTPDINTAEIKKVMLSCATETFMLCDSSKTSHINFVKFATVKDIDVLITDDGLDESLLAKLKKNAPEMTVYCV